MTAPSGTGRSGSGRLRNFKAMGDDKLWKTFAAVAGEGDDPEAREALEAEMRRRGFDVAHGSDVAAELAEYGGEDFE